MPMMTAMTRAMYSYLKVNRDAPFKQVHVLQGGVREYPSGGRIFREKQVRATLRPQRNCARLPNKSPA